MANGVHTTVNTVQPPAAGPIGDGTPPQAQLRELRERDNPVLPPGKRRKTPIERALRRFVRHNRTK